MILTAIPSLPNRYQTALKIYQKSHTNILKILTNKGIKPQLRILDNEASYIIKSFITEKHIDYQLTPACLHRINWDERAIQTLKIISLQVYAQLIQITLSIYGAN